MLDEFIDGVRRRQNGLGIRLRIPEESGLEKFLELRRFERHCVTKLDRCFREPRGHSRSHRWATDGDRDNVRRRRKENPIAQRCAPGSTTPAHRLDAVQVCEDRTT